jgi:hypothetical protein
VPAPTPTTGGTCGSSRGTATAFSWWALQDAGLVDDRETRATIRRWGAFGRRLGALQTYERRGGSDPEYALWHLAVRHLLADRGGRRRTRGDARLLPRRRPRASRGGRRSPTRSGVTVDAFYRDFAAARPAYARSARSR